MELTWDNVGERRYETGVDRGVLYLPDETGDYVDGYAWNGLTTVTESPSGAESNPQYADNIKYLNLVSAEEFGATINDSPEAITFSWDVSTTPVQVDGFKPTALLTIDSTKVAADDLAALEAILYGTVSDDARLPQPGEVIDLVTTGETAVDMATDASRPTFVDATGVLTLPAVTGVQWRVNGVNKAAGAQPAIAAGATIEVTAHAQPGYNLVGDDDWTFRRDA
jgi:hypothetical protein